MERLSGLTGVELLAGTDERDVAGFAIGRPLAIARPADEAALCALVTRCAERGLGLVPVGTRTAYWRPLSLEGHLALDLSALDSLRFEDGLMHAGAGLTVRAAMAALRARGLHLPLHPDAFGHTSLGSMVAVACTSGIGMGQGALGRWLAGLRVVDGRGRLIPTGSAVIGAPLMREGLPDLSGLMLGAEGALGVVSGLSLHLPPPKHLVHLRGRVEAGAGAAILALGRALAGLYDTLRAERSFEAGRAAGGGPAGLGDWTLDLWVCSPLSAEEARSRAEAVQRQVLERTGARLQPVADPHAGRLLGGPEDFARFASQARLVGLDVNAGYALGDELLALAQGLAEEAIAQRAAHLRLALYLSPEMLNLGLHLSLPEAQLSWGHAFQERGLAALSRLPVVPYRLGHAWPAAMREKLDPACLSVLRDLKRSLDPHGILHPGHAWL